MPCVANNPDGKAIKGPLGPQRIDGPWSRLQIDYTELPRSTKGNKYCLVIIDAFTKWIQAIPTWKNDVLTTAKMLVEQEIRGRGQR